MPDDTRRCEQCGKRRVTRRVFLIDGRWVCTKCLYGDVAPFEIYPIGVVRNTCARSEDDFGVCGGGEDVSSIELHPSQAPFLYHIEDERELTVVYYLHQARAIRSVFARGLDGKRVGVFASRTPDRLSHIAVQDVTLLRVEGTTLIVRGLDAVDGSPVLDIKLGWHALQD